MLYFMMFQRLQKQSDWGRAMRWIILFVSAALLISCGDERITGSSGTAGQSLRETAAFREALSLPQVKPGRMRYREGEVLVKFKSGTIKTVRGLRHEEMNARLLKRFSHMPSLDHVALPGGLTVEHAIAWYKSDPQVEYAEPNYIKYKSMTIPNDPLFGHQWGLRNTGAFFSGTPGADIKAADVWDISTGDAAVVVAVLDTGIDYTHPDLSGNIWRNPGEADCSDGEDDDLNGFVDDCRGWDFVSNTNDPMDDDIDGHGTHVSGIAGAVGNNTTGISGLMWRTRLMPLKFIGYQSDGDYYGDVAGEIAAIDYAVAMKKKGINVTVINASFAGPQFSHAEYDAIRSARDAGILVSAAAGNDGLNQDVHPYYPASFDLDNIISVAASSPRDQRATFTNYGPNSVHVAAPGEFIMSTVPFTVNSDGYATYDGTSMSTAYVSGLAGLLASFYNGLQNTLFDYSQVRATIFKYVDVRDTLEGFIETGGRINAYRALSSLLRPTELRVTDRSSSGVHLLWDDNATGEGGYAVERKSPGGEFTPLGNVGGGKRDFEDSGLTPETTYVYRVRAFNDIPAYSFYSNEVSATTLSGTSSGSGSSGGGGGGCSIIRGVGSRASLADALVMLIPFVVVFMIKRRMKD